MIKIANSNNKHDNGSIHDNGNAHQDSNNKQGQKIWLLKIKIANMIMAPYLKWAQTQGQNISGKNISRIKQSYIDLELSSIPQGAEIWVYFVLLQEKEVNQLSSLSYSTIYMHARLQTLYPNQYTSYGKLFHLAKNG